MKAIAACPNVCVKLSELGLKDAPWTVDSNRRAVLDTIDIFGIERCMWASNFPVAGLKVSYKDQLDGMREIMSGLSDGNLRKIFFKNAIDFYNIHLPSNG
jgi:predicted TIM-barrel fold metal-dependent hydrolase